MIVKKLAFVLVLSLSVSVFSQNSERGVTDNYSNRAKKKKYKIPEIDLTHWKVTLPIGKPDEVEPPEILDYGNSEKLKQYMYNDSVEGALVFYTVPDAKTANTKYSRTELREQMVSGDNNTNWTFDQGGMLRGQLRVADISKDKNGKYHKTIVMQIHGRLTNDQRESIGQKDNNAPPILKIYWQNGKIRVKTKVLKDKNMSNEEILHTDSWTDDKGYTFKQEVGFKKFTLEVKVEEGKMVVSLNDSEFVVYDDLNISRWSIFENYFKAGNYLITRDENAFATVKYYKLTVSH